MLDKERMKKEIMDLVQSEKNNFEKRLQLYKNLENATDGDYADLNADWIASLERIKTCYEKNNGQDSLFLRNTVTPLLRLLEEAKSNQNMTIESSANPLEFKPKDLQPNQKRVYVVLYQADGGDMSKWVVQLLSMPKLLATRPVYLDEDDARQACKSGNDAMTKGYISLIVDNDSIMQDEFALRRKDAADKQLVLLKDNAIENGGEIEYLVLGRERYRWLSNQLLPMFA